MINRIPIQTLMSFSYPDVITIEEIQYNPIKWTARYESNLSKQTMPSFSVTQLLNCIATLDVHPT
jgi:hypothetical protein